MLLPELQTVHFQGRTADIADDCVLNILKIALKVASVQWRDGQLSPEVNRRNCTISLVHYKPYKSKQWEVKMCIVDFYWTPNVIFHENRMCTKVRLGRVEPEIIKHGPYREIIGLYNEISKTKIGPQLRRVWPKNRPAGGLLSVQPSKIPLFQLGLDIL